MLIMRRVVFLFLIIWCLVSLTRGSGGCDSSCFACSGPSSSDCTSCFEGFLLHSLSNGVTEGGIGSCFNSEETNGQCLSPYLAEDQRCVLACDSSSITNRQSGVEYLRTRVPQTDVSRKVSSTEVKFVWSVPFHCFQNFVSYRTTYNEESLLLSTSTLNMDAFVVEMELHDTQLLNVDLCQASVSFSGNVFYSCSFQVESYYQDDLIMRWNFFLTAQMSQGIVLTSFLNADPSLISGEVMNLSLEATSSDDNIDVDDSDSQVYEFIVGKYAFIKVPAPSSTENIQATVTQVVVSDNQTSPPQSYQISTLVEWEQLQNGDVYLQVPLILVSESVEILIQIEWSFIESSERLRFLSEDSTRRVNSEVYSTTINIENGRDQQSSIELSDGADFRKIMFVSMVFCLLCM
mmetsp:Transcript_50894/g.58363  ORF Transcript_50894/g.58363 Transcript_50894/m.58363 type:complete len:405 (+) Transcript_50894:73-1287(+)